MKYYYFVKTLFSVVFVVMVLANYGNSSLAYLGLDLPVEFYVLATLLTCVAGPLVYENPVVSFSLRGVLQQSFFRHFACFPPALLYCNHYLPSFHCLNFTDKLNKALACSWLTRGSVILRTSATCFIVSSC